MTAATQSLILRELNKSLEETKDIIHTLEMAIPTNPAFYERRFPTVDAERQELELAMSIVAAIIVED